MISERAGAAAGRIFIRSICTVLVGVGAAHAHVAPEQQLKGLIEGTAALRHVFGDARIVSPSPTRAEASAEIGFQRQAIVVFRQEEKSPRIGTMYCHAALSRKERAAWSDELERIADGDALVAELLGKTYAPSVRLSRVEDWTVPAPFGWHAVVCSVASASIQVEPATTPGPEAVREAVYRTGKLQYFDGRHAEALERFRSLRADPVRYPDAVLFVYAILLDRNPEIAEKLREKVVDIERAADVDALSVYAGALRDAGHAIVEAEVQRRCSEIGERCER
ncbi:hypothetical protein [Thauera propionica]|uniref:hypothetical protein n=1 Tax=Thauera propionica TaxID=2019431 RepID=UPI0023F27AE3|nr:hypothetical protein [Thauera propionica]MDD3676496.1 hypothetical protein [Thauera propionica]